MAAIATRRLTRRAAPGNLRPNRSAWLTLRDAGMMGHYGIAELVALFALAAGGTFTPGPNNALLSASGARFGLRATVPHALGVALGFPLMAFAVAVGLGEAFRASPLLQETLRWLGAGLLARLAWRIATSTSSGRASGRERPWGFVQAAAFQWVNPKAWVMCLAIAAPFVEGEAPMRDAAVLAAVFVTSGLLSAHAWAAFGAAMGRWLGDGRRLRAFNIAMAGLLLLGVAALLTEDLSPPPA